MPRFRNINEKHPDFLRGYGIQGGASRSRGIGSDGIGAELKESLTEAGGWRFGFAAYGETLPYPENRITLNNELKDKWGRPTLTIDCSFKENEKKMHKDMVETMKEMLEKTGAKNIRHDGAMSFPGNANHEMGTARMGKDPKTSVLNKWNQVWDTKNVIITDGSCMTSNACVNPSLTYMAITARAVDYAVSEMRRGNL
jgi:choline dehydrogenase-like flavoprotein